MKKSGKIWLFVAGIVLLDQIVKILVKTRMAPGDFMSVFGDWFKIQFIENSGAAFGLRMSSLFDGLSEFGGRIILTVFSVLALAGIVFFLIRTMNHRSPMPWFLAMILGGALGNMIDRTFYGLWFQDLNLYEGGFLFGRVVDMFYFDLVDLPLPTFMGGGTYHLWPIFNVADVSITLGILVILFFQGRFIRQHEQASDVDAREVPSVS